MALWATFLSGADMVMHAAGWLEGGLVTSFEKLALDLELLRMFDWLAAGIEVDDEHVALEAIREVGPGGMFLAAGHTLEHFREWSFMSPMFRAQAYPTWQKLGSPRADETAVHVWQALRDRYVDPGLDPATDEALQAFIARRRLELDD